MAVHHVGITSDFFARGLKDYADWRWAWPRELAQNGMDSGASTIHFAIRTNVDGDTEATCWNDGPPMTKEVLLDKFLCLGGTTKTFAGTVGGFGIAKTVCCLAHKSYQIETGSYMVAGVGGQFELTEQQPFSGTRTTVIMNGDHTEAILQAIRKFIGFAQWDGTFVVNGEELRGDLRKGSPRRDLGFATVYSNKSFRYVMVVRINGIPMFTKGINLDRCVVVELQGRSDEILTANRDGLVWPMDGELSDFVTELAVDKRSALKVRQPKYVQYRGTKMCNVRQLNVVDCVDAPLAPFLPFIAACVGNASEGASTVAWSMAAQAVATESKVPKSKLGTNFILKNQTDRKVPAYYDPGTGEFSEYSRKLVRIWGRLLLELHRLFDAEAEFSVGFVFDDESEAEHEQGSYGQVYYVNPCKVVEQKSSCSKSFQKRFKLTERGRLIAIAAHEFVHGLGFNWHSEDYACKLTDVVGVILSNSSRFAWCFK